MIDSNSAKKRSDKETVPSSILKEVGASQLSEAIARYRQRFAKLNCMLDEEIARQLGVIRFPSFILK